MDEVRAFIGINFVMRYHKLPNLRSYWGTESPSLSVSFVANVMKRERFKEILSNLQFLNNEDVAPRDRPAHDRAFKVRWLINYLNERFLSSMEPEVEKIVDEHMIKYKREKHYAAAHQKKPGSNGASECGTDALQRLATCINSTFTSVERRQQSLN